MLPDHRCLAPLGESKHVDAGVPPVRMQLRGGHLRRRTPWRLGGCHEQEAALSDQQHPGDCLR